MRTKQGVIENRTKMDPEVYKLLDAFAKGVNSYIYEHRSEVPDWIDGITARTWRHGAQPILPLL